MGFLECLGLFVVLYYLISIILWFVLDSDIGLAIKEKFGKPVSSLKGRVCWITGASSGIGRSLAIHLAKNGVKLAISARRENELQKVKEECLKVSSDLNSADILVLPMDLLQFETHEKKFQSVLKHFGKLDILVNNAGRSQRAPWDSIDIKVDRDLFDLDVFSVIHLSRIAVRYFKTLPECKGHIGITSSGAGLTPVPFSASYCGAKHALHGYFAALKVEEPAIDVTCFCPGPIATPFLEQSFTDKVDVKYGIPVSASDKRMTADRCGELFAIALANKIMLAWAGLFPVSALLYISQYFPNIRMLIFKLLGTRGMKKIREGSK